MSTEWDEVKRLAADFQRAQLSSTVQRLSERNCVEIVNKLVAKKLLYILFTTDGKEYITPQQVQREIKDELFVKGGRVYVSELSQTLLLDYTHVENAAVEFTRTEKRVQYLLGQLVDKIYLDRIFEEINEKLQQTGQVTVGDVAKLYDLPPEFVQQSMKSRLGQILDGEVDPFDSQVIFTAAFIDRHRARVRGALLGATRPTAVNSVISRHSMQNRLFFTTLDELLTSGALSGTVTGGPQEIRTSTYVPNIYAKAKSDWVDSFYRQNNYLDYDALERLGITDPQGFVRKRYGKQEHLLFLETCAINTQILEQIEAAVEDQLAGASSAEISSACPSFFSDEDVQQVLHTMLSRSQRMSDVRLFCQTVLVKNNLIENVAEMFDDIMKVKAEQALQLGLVNWGSDSTGDVKNKGGPQNDSKKDRKEERRKKATGGKSGGGTQGRETKMKSAKKKYLRGDNVSDDDGDDAAGQTKPGTKGSSGQGKMAFMDTAEIEETLRSKSLVAFEDCPYELLTELAQHLEGLLGTKFQELTRSLYLATIGSNSSLRKSHGDVQDKINGLLINVNLFVKGVDVFAGDVKMQLHKHLLRTVCSDITNLVFGYVAQESMHSTDQYAHLTPEVRTKLIGKLPESCRDVLSKLNASLNGKSVDDFLAALDQTLAHKTCDMIIKKVDKKKEKQVVLGHKQGLVQQLRDVAEPALVLHLSVLILFQTFTQNLLHASGKFVPQILNFLEKYLASEIHELMHNYQGLVMCHLTSTDNPEYQASIRTQLDDLMPKIKEAAINTKKGTPSESSAT